MTLRDVTLLLLAYLLGSIPFGFILTRYRSGEDIREMGSGNIGATNVLRTQGKLLAVATLVLDFSKAALPVWFCRRWGSESLPWMGTAGGAAAVLGHCFPVWLRFRGGKGIASGLGAFVFIAPFPTVVALGVWLLEVLTLKYISVGSIIAALTFGILMVVLHYTLGWYDAVSAWIGFTLGLLLVTRHHSNIRKLIKGAEPDIQEALKRGKTP